MLVYDAVDGDLLHSLKGAKRLLRIPELRAIVPFTSCHFVSNGLTAKQQSMHHAHAPCLSSLQVTRTWYTAWRIRVTESGARLTLRPPRRLAALPAEGA